MTLAEQSDYANLVAQLVRTRQQTSPKRLQDPGPSAEQVRELFAAAAQAPDHGLIVPWRFVHVSAGAARVRLGEAFSRALRERDTNATAAQLQDAKDKALRGPFLSLAIARLSDDHPEIAPAERLVSLGCALQNMLLMAHAQGFGAGLVSGQAMEAQAMRRLFSLEEAEQAVCFIIIGTVSHAKASQMRPVPDSFVSML